MTRSILLALLFAACSLGPDLPHPVASEGDEAEDTGDTGEESDTDTDTDADTDTDTDPDTDTDTDTDA